MEAGYCGGMPRSRIAKAGLGLALAFLLIDGVRGESRVRIVNRSALPITDLVVEDGGELVWSKWMVPVGTLGPGEEVTLDLPITKGDSGLGIKGRQGEQLVRLEADTYYVAGVRNSSTTFYVDDAGEGEKRHFLVSWSPHRLFDWL